MSKFALTNEQDIINAVLESEGEGLVENDAGAGVSKWGVTKDFHPDLTEDDIRNMTRDRAYQIYKDKYWNAIDADNIPENLRSIAFDTAINSGPARAKQFLARSNGDFASYYQQRVEFYQGLINKGTVTRANGNQVNYAQYARGWGNRIGFDFETNTATDPWVVEQLGGNPEVQFNQQRYNANVETQRYNASRTNAMAAIKESNDYLIRRANERPGRQALRFDQRPVLAPIPPADSNAAAAAPFPEGRVSSAADVGVTRRFEPEYNQAVIDTADRNANKNTALEGALIGADSNFLGRTRERISRSVFMPEGPDDPDFNNYDKAKEIIMRELETFNAPAAALRKRYEEGMRNGQNQLLSEIPAEIELNDERFKYYLNNARNIPQLRFLMSQDLDIAQRKKDFESKSGAIGEVYKFAGSMLDADVLLTGGTWGMVKATGKLAARTDKIGDVAFGVTNALANNRGKLVLGAMGVAGSASAESFTAIGQEIDPVSVVLDGAVVGLSLFSLPKGFDLSTEEIAKVKDLVRNDPEMTFEEASRIVSGSRTPVALRDYNLKADYNQPNQSAMPSPENMPKLKQTLEIQSSVKNIEDEIANVEKQSEAIRDVSTKARTIFNKLQAGVRDADVVRAARDLVNRLNPGRFAVRAGESGPIVDTLRGQADMTNVKLPRNLVKRGSASLRLASKAIDFEDTVDQVAFVLGKKDPNISQVWKDAAVELEKRGYNIKNLTEYGAVLRGFVKDRAKAAPGDNVFFSKDDIRSGVQGLLDQKPWIQSKLDEAFTANAQNAGKILDDQEVEEVMDLLDEQAKTYEDLVAKRNSLGEQRSKVMLENGAMANENGEIIRETTRKAAYEEDILDHLQNLYNADTKLQDSMKVSKNLFEGGTFGARILNWMTLSPIFGDNLKAMGESALGMSAKDGSNKFAAFFTRFAEVPGLDTSSVVTAENMRAIWKDRFVGDTAARFEELLDAWAGKVEGFMSDAKLAEFNEKVSEMVNRFKNLEEAGIEIPKRETFSVKDAIVYDAVQLIAERMKLIKESASKGGVRGFENVSGFSNYYLRWSIDPKKFNNYLIGPKNEANRLKYIERIADEVSDHYPDIPRDKAIKIANTLFDVQASRANGSVPITDFTYHGSDFPSEVRLALEDVLSKEAAEGSTRFKDDPFIQELMDRTKPEYVKGQAKSTKRRLKRDILAPLEGTTGPNGKALRMMDVMDTDVMTSLNIHANSVAGELGLISIGVPGKMELMAIRNSLFREGGEFITERMDILDRTIAYYTGQPYKGFDPGPAVLGLTSLTRSMALGVTGAANIFELATMTATAGISEAMKKAPEFLKFIGMGKNAMKNGEFDPEFAWQLGAPHFNVYDVGRGLSDVGVDNAADKTGNMLKRLEFGIGYLSLNRRTSAAARTVAMNIATSTLMNDIIKGVKFDGNVGYIGSRMSDDLAERLKPYISNVTKQTRFDLQRMPDGLKNELLTVVNRRFRKMINEPFNGQQMKAMNSQAGRIFLTLKNYLMNSQNLQLIAAYKAGGGKKVMADIMSSSAAVAAIMVIPYTYQVANRYAAAKNDQEREEVLEKMLSIEAIALFGAQYLPTIGITTELAKASAAIMIGTDLQGNDIPNRGAAVANQIAPAVYIPLAGTVNVFRNAVEVPEALIKGEDVKIQTTGIPGLNTFAGRAGAAAVQNIINENN